MFRRKLFIVYISCIILITFLVLNPFGNARSRNVILVGWDGVGWDAIQSLLSKERLPNLKALISQGKLVSIYKEGATDTKAGWAAVLTGYDPEITGVYSNSRYQTIPAGYTIFERLEKDFGRKAIITAAFISKKENLSRERPQGPYATAQAKTDIFLNDLGNMENVQARVLDFLKEYSDKRFFLFIHYAEPDWMGHTFGEGSDEMDQAIIACDAKLGELLKQLKEYKIDTKTLVYVTADHGFDKGAKHHNAAPYVFLATNDPTVIRNGLTTDIAPTILVQFGLKLNRIKPPLSGRPLSEESR